MSRFLITMNMPTKNDNLVHQVIGEHPAESLEEFMDALQASDFVVVDEFYKNPYGDYYSTGQTVLNHRYVGKVRLFNNQTHARKNDGD
jgi:hypothetical protein